MKTGRHNINPYLNCGLIIIHDPLPAEDGGYSAGTVFSHTDTLSMLEHCAFTTGTEVEFRGCRYHIVTINSPSGSKQIMAKLEIINQKGE